EVRAMSWGDENLGGKGGCGRIALRQRGKGHLAIERGDEQLGWCFRVRKVHPEKEFVPTLLGNRQAKIGARFRRKVSERRLDGEGVLNIFGAGTGIEDQRCLD